MGIKVTAEDYEKSLAAYRKSHSVTSTIEKKDETAPSAGKDIVLGTLFMNPAKIARGVASATGKETSDGAKKALGWASMPGAKIEQGFFGAAEGITDFLAGGAAQIAGQKDAAKWIYEHSWSRDAVGADVTDEYVGDAAKSKGYQIASDLLSGVGNVGFQIAVGTLIGGALAAPVEAGTISQAGARAIAFAPLFASASGAGTAENIAKTGELGWRENVGGLLKGGVEVLTEVISPTGKIVDRAINGKSAGSIFRYLSKHAVAKNIIVDFASEAGEEMASYAGGWFIENKLKISDEAFSARDMVYQGVLGGITGAIFAAPSDISLVRSARSSGAKVYAQGEAAVQNKINEGLIEVAALKERGLNNDNVKLAEAALAKLTTDENLSQTTKEYYLGLAEQMVLKQNLSDQYNALAKELVEKAKADPATAQSMADAFNALVNEAGGEGKYTAADFTNENSEAARIYVVAQMANNWLSRSDAQTAMDEIMQRKAALYQGTAEQKNAISSMQDGSTVAFRVGSKAYAVVTKRAGTDTYSVGFTTPGQVERDGAVYATHKLSADKVEELLSKPMTEQQIDAGIVNRAEASGQEQEQAEKPKRKRKPKQTTATENVTTENVTTETTTGAEQAESEEQKREREREERRKQREERAKRNAERLAALKKKKNYGLPDGIVSRARERMERLFGKPEAYPFTVSKRGTVTITSPGMFDFPQKTRYTTIEEAINDVKQTIERRGKNYYLDSEEIKSLDVNNAVEQYKISKEEFVRNPDLYNGIKLLESDIMNEPWEKTLENLQAYKAKKEERLAKQKPNPSLSPATAESAQTEQTTQQAQTEAKKVKPEDLSTVEKRLTSAFGIDGSEFTKEEWTKARECVPNIDGLTRREQARVLTLVRTAQAHGINEDYMKGLARLSSVYGFGVVFEDIDVSGFYSRKNGMVVINPNNLDETYGHEIKHSFDQIVKEGKAEFRTDLSEKVRKIVGASVFDRAKAQYKADYEKLRARDGSVAEMSDAELEAEATANVVGKYLSNMTLLKKLAATDYSLGRGILAAIRRMKDKWTSAKAFAKENDSTAFAEYRKMTRIEKLLVEELNKAKKAKQTETKAPSGENISYSPGEWDEGRGRGYDGYSMSNNARDAYASGEKPLSKWTKADILDAVEEIAPDKVDLVKTVSVRVLKANLLYRSSWHHTSEYYNRTDFYSVNDDLLENLTKEDVKRWVENTAKESPAEQTRKYRGDIHYLEWGGTRNHPRATEQTLKNVNIEERGSFYIVTDDNGKELLRKKIGSNGTYVTDYEYEARLERQRQAAKDAEDNNSTEAARALFKKWTGKDKISERGFGIGIEESRSGNIYKYGRKPGSWQYDHLDDFFEKGEQRLSKNENGGYFVETWDGEKWVAEAKKTNGGVSYSPSPVTRETDARYLSLARDPQKNESELRRLVKKAAEKAGLDSPLLYHGTGAFGFTTFDLSKMDDRRTIFLTDSEEIASTYSGSKGIRGVSGKANIPDNVDAVYIATELNNNLPAQEQDNGYYYTAYSRKALSNLEKQNRIDLAKLKLFLKEKGYEYGEESSWSHKFAATIGQLTFELNKLYNSKKNNLSTPIYILANNTDLFGGFDVEINGNYGLESRIRLAMRLSEFFSNNAETNTVKDSVVAKVGMDGYDVEVYSYDDARALLEENSGRGNYGLYANLDNTIEINGDGRNWNTLLYQADVSRFYEPIQGAHGYRIYNTFTNETFYLADNDSGEFATREEAQKRIDKMVDGYKYRIARLETTREVSRWAQAMGYSGVILRNITDNGGQNISVGMGEKANIYMLFDPASLKSADPVTYDKDGNVIPLSERFNPQNDDIRYSPASPNTSGRVVTQAKPPRQTITEKITNEKGQLNRQGFRNALKEAGSVVEGFKVLTVNAQQAVENQLVLMGMTKSQAGALMQYARSARSHSLNAAQYKLADMTGEIRSDGFLKIIEPYLAKKGEVYDAVDHKTGETKQYTAKGGELAGKLYDEFQDYYAMLHALDREAVGKNPYSGMSVDEMKAWVEKHEKAHPDFKAAADKLSAFNSALLDIEAQAGIRSQETVDLWKKQYPHYVPMYVQEDGEIGRAPVRGARNMEVRRDNAVATESDHRVNDALQNYLNKLQRRIRAAKFNLVLQEVYNSADGVNVVKGEQARATARNLREQERAYLDNPEMENDPVEAFRKVQKGRNTVNEVSFYMDGKRVTMAVSDRIYTGLADLSGVHSSVLDLGVVKFVSKINDTFKKLVTNWNPFFAVKNIARDLQDGLLNSKFGMGEFLAMYKKNVEMMMSGKYNKEWELFLANGAIDASLLSDEFNTLAKSGKSGLEQGTGVVGQFQHIKNFNTLTEALPRFTEFCLTLKHGGTIQQAIYNAADVTVNFSRSGVLTRILNKTVSPFLNPAVQGLDRVIRLFTEEGIKNNKALASLLLKAVLLAIVPMALGNAMYGDDDEYKDMKDSIKENNYLFKVGETWLKLPRGRVISTVAGLFNRSYKQLTGQETDWGDYGKNVLDQITPAQNVARHIGSPFMDVANNRTWYGTKIESDALQNYAVNQRYDENTSRVSVWIGQLTSHFGLSPKEVNYLIDQYTGVIGDILLPTTTPAGTKGVVSYNFTVDPNTSSNLSSRFYDLYNKTMYKTNDGDVEAYYLKKRLDETKSAVSELFKQIKTINASSELSNKEKVKQASAIRASINQLYKTALDDRRLYEQNIKDALAIENSYAVEKITAQSAKRYGLDSDAVGKYALTFGGDFAKQFNTEAQANDYKADASKKTVYAEANRLTYGAEYALREYNVNVYDKAKTLNEIGIDWEDYYSYYMTARYYSGKTKKDKILAYLNGSGLSKSQIALMMYYSGYTAYADEAKKAIKASSLSAERKKELLAGITD